MSYPRNRSLFVAALLVAVPAAAAPAEKDATPRFGISGRAPLGREVSNRATANSMPAALHLAVTRSLAREASSEYRIDADGRGVNPRHGLRLAFTRKGARIAASPETSPSPGQRATHHELALRLERFGRGDGEPVHPTTPRIDGARVVYDRGSGLREWFVNLPQGVEQGWTVAQRPAGDGPLVLELDTGRPPDRVDDERLAWSGLVYHGLITLDAEGRELPTRWASDGRRLRIEVDDATAAYPVVIDPWLQEARLSADGAELDVFGRSVALSGDTALIGAPGADVGDDPSQGAAYVYIRSGEIWTQQAKLTASGGGPADAFGTAVALAGDTALVTAPNAVTDGGARTGAAYVFTRSGENWSPQATLVADDGAQSDLFGDSAALFDDTIVIGAPTATVDGAIRQGAAYIFSRGGGTWSQQAKLIANDGAAGDVLGVAVALTDDMALVGTDWATVDGHEQQGAVYVFTRSGGVWNQQQKLTADDGARLDSFGAAIAVAGGTALVGAPFADIGDNFFQGAVYVFTRGGGTWAQEAKITADDGSASDRFGSSVAVVDTTALIGAPNVDGDGNGDREGAAYVLTGSGTDWSTVTRITVAGGDGGDELGGAVALSSSGATALLGAPYANVDGGNSQGAAYVFRPPLMATTLAVDFAPSSSDGNGVFEPDEQVALAPGWHNGGDSSALADGSLFDFAGPIGAFYGIVTDATVYGPVPPGETGSCRDSQDGCYELGILLNGGRPALHWDATVEEELQLLQDAVLGHTWTLHVGDSFTDVPRTSPFYSSIETLLHSGITGGCSETGYCPGGANSRAQMPVFVLKALEGPDYVPPACVEGDEAFNDVPFDDVFCPWIEELAHRDVVSGCGGDDYCPASPVTRAQMAIFLLKTLEGGDYTPPECTGTFVDVPCPSTFAAWIEDLATREITGGCTATEYCPGSPVSRAQMAVFVTKTFGLTLYGP